MRLHWREAGDPRKPPVVWIHGGSVEDSSVMVSDLEPFFAKIRALFPDTRGHGLSSRFERSEDYTYPRKAEDMLLWADAVGVRDAVWGGASMGAALSLWLAAHHPLLKTEWVKLFKRSFVFTGGEIVGEFLMSIGYLPGAHAVDCPVYKKLSKMRPPWLTAERAGMKFHD